MTIFFSTKTVSHFLWHKVIFLSLSIPSSSQSLHNSILLWSNPMYSRLWLLLLPNTLHFPAGVFTGTGVHFYLNLLTISVKQVEECSVHPISSRDENDSLSLTEEVSQLFTSTSRGAFPQK